MMDPPEPGPRCGLPGSKPLLLPQPKPSSTGRQAQLRPCASLCCLSAHAMAINRWLTHWASSLRYLIIN